MCDGADLGPGSSNMAPLDGRIECRESVSWRTIGALEGANEVSEARGDLLDEELALQSLLGVQLEELYSAPKCQLGSFWSRFCSSPRR